jgi:hypothetical protein
MNGNPIQNQTLDSKGSRQITHIKKVSILRNNDFLGNINIIKNSPKQNKVNQNKIII